MKTEKLKTPITYYGGKQNMVRHILPLIPEHHTYIEPFFGGGAIFFAKHPSPAEVVNDINNRLVTFYKVLKYDFEEIQRLVDETFHSRAQHKESEQVYESQKDEISDPVHCAWSVWVQTNMSFSSTIGGGFGYDRRGKSAYRTYNKKNRFTEAYTERLKKVTIESYDVLKVIRAYDAPDAFFYLDPPYVSADQGHYAGYSTEDFRALLDACAGMQGKFLLSSYPEDVLMEYREKHGWKVQDHVKTLAVDGRRKANRTKVECLTWNY
ncbi:DNA adenine methylase [Dyadobacter soli]|uniref:DNA adenine methylase n=1 Tax=Dyadobacter soli TaxID=659014 RepID=A0A1G7WHA2_9BACT|nr:DNA adenine methylase [Dyadobacter soli]SDG71244.1 DNA adenine methylase [Dyadobacter soli]